MENLKEIKKESESKESCNFFMLIFRRPRQQGGKWLIESGKAIVKID
jgi:hypothetical protein